VRERNYLHQLNAVLSLIAVRRCMTWKRVAGVWPRKTLCKHCDTGHEQHMSHGTWQDKRRLESGNRNLPARFISDIPVLSVL
jgi:hypothetical protein